MKFGTASTCVATAPTHASVTASGLDGDAGAPNVQLQASPMGEPIYRRMGYEDLYRDDFYLCAGPKS